MSKTRTVMRLRRAPGLAIAVLLAWAAPAAADGPWTAGLYTGIGSNGGIEDIPGQTADFVDSYLLALTAGKQLGAYKHYLTWEAEGQVVKHFKKQNHWELNAALILRWHPFRKNGQGGTSLAIGEGVSYATDLPEIEIERGGETARLLNYLMVELAFAPTGKPRHEFFTRLHHRSGLRGLYSGVSKGSNFYAIGLRYRFY